MSVMKLNQIADRPGARKTRQRIGRGIGSGMGKTGGRGGKGQTARSGVRIKGFEGGQMPLHRRLPKRGFNNIFAKRLNELNLGRVQAAIDAGKLDVSTDIDAAVLVNAGLLRRAWDGVRLLGDGELKAKVNFAVHGASKSAVAAVEKAGGTVKILAPKKEEDAEPRGKNKQRLLAEARGEKPKPGKSEGDEQPKAEKPKAEKPKAEKPKDEQSKAEKPAAKPKAEKGEAKGDKKPKGEKSK
jgi:large subunit ribosomal protein L15